MQWPLKILSLIRTKVPKRPISSLKHLLKQQKMINSLPSRQMKPNLFSLPTCHMRSVHHLTVLLDLQRSYVVQNLQKSKMNSFQLSTRVLKTFLVLSTTFLTFQKLKVIKLKLKTLSLMQQKSLNLQLKLMQLQQQRKTLTLTTIWILLSQRNLKVTQRRSKRSLLTFFPMLLSLHLMVEKSTLILPRQKVIILNL